MKILRFIYLTFAQAYYNRALAHDPLHPDLERVLHKRVALRDEARKLFA